MASKELQKITSDARKRTRKKQSTKSTLSYPVQQAQNIDTRLSSIGYDTQKELDHRNAFEKLLNMKSDTGTPIDLWNDFTELLGRPQQSLYGAIDNAIEGESVLKGAGEGLKGNTDLHGKDLLQKVGIGNDEKFNIMHPSTYVDDVLGLAMDLFLDPADLVGVGLVNKAGKGAKILSKADDIGDMAKAVKAGDTIADLTGMVDKVGDAVKVADKVGDTHKALKIGIKRPFSNDDELTTLTEYAFKQLGKGAKAVGKTADFGLETFLDAYSPKWANRYKDVKINLNDIFNSSNIHSRGETLQNLADVKSGSGVGRQAIQTRMTKDLTDLGNNLSKKPEFLTELNKVTGLDLSDALKQSNPQAYQDNIHKFVSWLAQDENMDRVKKMNMDGYTMNDIIHTFGDNLQFNKNGDVPVPLKALENSISLDKHRAFKGKSSLKSHTAPSQFSKMLTRATDAIKDKLLHGDKKDLKWLTDNCPNLVDFMNKGGKDIGDLLYKEQKYAFIPKEIADELLKVSAKEGYTEAIGKLNPNFFESIGYYTKGTLGGTDVDVHVFKDLIKKHDIGDIVKPFEHYTDKMNMKYFEEIVRDNPKFKDMDFWKGSEFKDANYQHSQLNEEAQKFYEEFLKGHDTFKEYQGRKISSVVDPTIFNAMQKDIAKEVRQSTNELLRYATEIPDAKRGDFINMLEHNGLFDTGDDLIQSITNMYDPKHNKFLSKTIDDAMMAQRFLNDNVQKTLKEFRDVNADIMQKIANKEDVDFGVVEKMINDTASPIYTMNYQVYNKLSKTTKDRVIKINNGWLSNHVNSMNKIIDAKLGEDTGLSDLIKSLNLNSKYNKSGVNLYMDKEVAHMFDLIDDAPKTAEAILDSINDFNNEFKSLKLASPGFNIRNYFGNAFNMIMAGMPPRQAFKGVKEGLITLNNFNKAQEMMKAGQEITDPVLKQALRDVNELSKMGFSEAGTALYDVKDLLKKGEGSPIRRGLQKLNALNIGLNNDVDLAGRLGMAKFAKENPKWMKRMGFNSTYDAVKFALFDPADVSMFEDRVIRKVVPFYTYAKKNIMFQIQNLSKNGKHYYEMSKLVDSMWNSTGLEDDEINDYRKSGMELPIPFMNNGDSVRTLAVNPPATDLFELMENPVKTTVNKLSPLLKAPIEYATNTQTYTGRPISEFKGQKGRLFEGTPLENTPLNTAMGDWMLSNVGLDVPLKTIKNGGKLLSDIVHPSVQDALTDAGNFFGVIKENDPAKARFSNEMNQLKEYQDLLKKIQQNEYVPTMNEINNSKSDNLAVYVSRAKALLNK